MKKLYFLLIIFILFFNIIQINTEIILEKEKNAFKYQKLKDYEIDSNSLIPKSYNIKCNNGLLFVSFNASRQINFFLQILNSKNENIVKTFYNSDDISYDRNNLYIITIDNNKCKMWIRFPDPGKYICKIWAQKPEEKYYYQILEYGIEAAKAMSEKDYYHQICNSKYFD